jgi:tetratricopeptide (TPR) repeat protein
VEIAQGHVTDRPFARTIYTVAARRFTGDLVLTEAGRRYKLSWEDGLVVAADSPSPADSAGRIALSAGLVTSTLLAESLEILGKSPERDPTGVLVELARLSPEQVARLKRRLLAHQAARAFALADARFALDNARSLKADPLVPPIDARWLIYFGLKTHYSVERLEAELAPVAGRSLQLASDALGTLAAFGFAAGDKPVLERLRQRAWTLGQLVDASPEDSRTVQAILYALVACDCLEEGAPVTSQVAPPGSSRTPARQSGRGLGTGPPERAARPPPTPAATARLAEGTVRQIRFAADPVAPALPAAAPPDSNRSAASETRSLIQRKLHELDAGADHFAMLGVPQSAPLAQVRSAYFGLAKRLHPDRLRAVGVGDAGLDPQRLFARINLAFGVLSDPERRAEYVRVLSAGGEAKVKRSQADAEEMAVRALRAEEAFRRGEMALRSSQIASAREQFEEAVRLSPDEPEYQALLAWATWVGASDRVSVGAAVLKRLNEAIRDAPLCVPAHFYLAQVAKQSGQPDAAIRSFRKVLELEPQHAEAGLELRLLESRARRNSGGFRKKR